MAIKTIFLDRDGVINREVSYLHKIKDFEFIKGVFEACTYFLDLNYSIIIISNQSGIGRGLYSEEDYQKICLLYTSPSPRDVLRSRMPSSA